MTLAFGAKKIGQFQLASQRVDEPRKAISMYRLTGTYEDLAWVRQGAQQMQAEQDNPKGTSMVPVLAGVNRDRHQRLVDKTFRIALRLLEHVQAGTIAQCPELLVAVDDQKQQLVGMLLGHIERRLGNGQKTFSFSKHRGHGVLQNRSGLDWVFSIAPYKGVGSALVSSMFLNNPTSNDSKPFDVLDVLSITPKATPQAIALYRKMGFKPLPALQDQSEIPHVASDLELVNKPDEKRLRLETANEQEQTAMSVDYPTFQRRAKSVWKKHQFVPIDDPKDYDLTQIVSFPKYAIKR